MVAGQSQLFTKKTVPLWQAHPVKAICKTDAVGLSKRLLITEISFLWGYPSMQ
jgi:hypothetical protein